MYKHNTSALSLYILMSNDSLMYALANTEDQDEMPHFAAFHQSLHCLPRQKRSSKKYKLYLEIIACDPLIHVYTIDHPKVNISSQKEESISASGLQIYGGPGSLSHDFKIWPITFQGSGPSGPILFRCEKISLNKNIHLTASL